MSPDRQFVKLHISQNEDGQPPQPIRFRRISVEETAPIMSRQAFDMALEKGISNAAINATFEYGTVGYPMGATSFTLLACDVKQAKRPDLEKFAGTSILVTTEENAVFAVYLAFESGARKPEVKGRDFKRIPVPA